MPNNGQKSESLIIFGDLNYPTGSAPSNRVHLYCKALKETGVNSFIINVSSCHTTAPNFGYLGKYDGIPFYYCQKTPMYENNPIKRNVRKIIGIINSFFVFYRLKKKKKVTVLFYSLSSYYEIIYYIFLKIFKTSIIKEYNEAPLFVIRNKRYKRVHFWLLKSLKLKMYNGIIVISDYLNNYFSAIYPKNKIFQIPILVDINRFNEIPKIRNREKIITYIGYMGVNKDGLNNLIEAISIVKREFQPFKVQLVGYGPQKDVDEIKRNITDLQLNDVVVFLGTKPASEIPEILLNSDLLVLARPNSSQAKAGFPTKLGEYLASKKPVVITRTGEIAKYLVDNENAYVVEPDNNESFAKKIIYALQDPKANSIGLNGFLVADANFNYKAYKKKLKEIFNLKA
jgi:glycosyltransferase involved in cell wall biosynthesis